MKRKMKRYEDGGVTEGENVNIDEDTRSRALAWARKQAESASEEPEVEKPKAKPRAKPKVAVKAKPEPIKQERSVKTEDTVKVQKPSMYSRPMMEDVRGAGRAIGDAITARRDYMQSRPVGPTLQQVRGQGYKKGGNVTTSRRGDGIAQRGKTKGRMI